MPHFAAWEFYGVLSAERLVYMDYLSVRTCHVTVKIATELIVSTIAVIRGESV